MPEKTPSQKAAEEQAAARRGQPTTYAQAGDDTGEQGGLTEAQKAGQEAAARGEPSKPSLGESAPGAPDYKPPTAGPVRTRKGEEEQIKSLGIGKGPALEPAIPEKTPSQLASEQQLAERKGKEVTYARAGEEEEGLTEAQQKGVVLARVKEAQDALFKLEDYRITEHISPKIGEVLTTEEFKKAIKEGRLSEVTAQYDIIKAINDGHLDDVQKVFDPKTVQIALSTIKVMQDIKPYTDDKGNVNIYLAIADYKEGRGGISPDDLQLVFGSQMVGKAVGVVETSRETKVALPGEKFWQDINTGKEYTDEEQQQRIKDYEVKRDALIKQGKMFTKEWFDLGDNPANTSHLSVASGRRLGVEVTTFMFSPAKAALPEYTIADVSAAEWGLGAVNVALIAAGFAPGAIMGSAIGKGALYTISGIGTGIAGLETAKDWAKLTPLQRVMGVGGTLLYSLPLLSTVARGIRIKPAEAIPTEAGNVVAWKGLAVAEHPVIGVSEGKLVIGARNITLPEARLILDGYKPEMMLETKVFVNSKALAKAGFSGDQISYLETTLKDRNLFAGKKSPYFAKEVLIEPTARLDADEVGVLLKKIQEYNKDIKQVDALFGSATIKPQLAPELRAWREVHDWDIQTSMSEADTATFAKEIKGDLEKLPGKRNYRINPEKPLFVEKKIKGEWKHIADIHSREISPESADIPSSKLDSTGAYSYGRMVAEKAITVKYPGLGEFDIQTLSESGVQKADTILRVRQMGKETKFAPPERGKATLHLPEEVIRGRSGITAMGVPKDAADFYVILRTFKGQKLADEWADSWAKAMGYASKELPKIRKAMVDIATETPTNIVGYRFRPAKSTEVAAGASPSITIYVPRSLELSVSSKALRQAISSPVDPYASVPSLKSALPSGSLGASHSSVKAVMSLSGKASAKVSPKVSPLVSAVRPSPASRAKPSIGVKPSPSKPISPPSRPPSPPSPRPSPPPPSPPVPPPTKPPPRPPIKLPTGRVLSPKELQASVAWKQGFIYKLWYPPYGQSNILNTVKPIPGVPYYTGPESAYKSIIKLGARLPREDIKRTMGIVGITVRSPGEKPIIRFAPRGRARVRPRRNLRRKSELVVGGIR